MEAQNSKAYDQLGVQFFSSNEQDLLMNQAEDTEKNCETLVTEVLSSDDRIPNQQTQHFQISDVIPGNDNELNLEIHQDFLLIPMVPVQFYQNGIASLDL